LAQILTERRGPGVELIDGPAGPHVRWRGAKEPKVLVLGHHDTVFPMGTLERRPFEVEAGRATGPGVFDMKAGIVQAIWGVAASGCAESAELLFSCDEEVGSITSRALIEERAVACGSVLVLEPSADGGALKVGRKGTGTFQVVIHGRASHAGLEPEKGINSLIEAAHQVLAIAALGDADRGTTVTPTVARAGTADNVVPAETMIRVDVRVTGPEEAARIEAAMASLTPVNPDASIEVSGSVGRPPMPEGSAGYLLDIARAHDEEIGAVVVGGGSDGNFTAALGVPTLDGMGAVGGGAHADHEHVLVSTMPERARLVAAVVAGCCA
ncbi:MAG: M20 family metallopeptidase, partial [Ilumatobacteraceae bacterium]